MIKKKFQNTDSIPRNMNELTNILSKELLLES